MEYEGSASGAPNPNVVDGDGGATLGATIGATLGQLGQIAIDGWSILSAPLSIPAASASNYSIMTPYGQAGFLTLTGLTFGMPLGLALMARGASLDIVSGRIHDASGHSAGHLDLDYPGAGTATVGPINIDMLTQMISTATPGGMFQSVQIPGDIAAGLASIDGIPLQQTARYWRPWVSSTRGVPIMDYPNLQNLFSPTTRAFLRPNFVGGKDGIYRIRDGRRVVPPEGPGHPAPAGFQIGATANYQVANVALGWTNDGAAGCYPWMWGYYGGDWFEALSPVTGTLPVIAWYGRAKIWNGSQQISMDGYPGWDYTGVPPHFYYPGFNSRFPGYIGWSNVAQNSVIAGYSGRDPGGPDGGPA